MASLKITAFALALLGSSMVIGQASAAMPVNGLTAARTQISDSVQHVRYWGPGWRYGRWGYGRWGYGRWGYGRWGYGRWAWGYGPGWRHCGWRRCWW